MGELEYDIQGGFDPTQRSYQGPSWQLSTGLVGTMDPLLESDPVEWLMETMGLEHVLDIDTEIFSTMTPRDGSPKFTLRSEHDVANDEADLTLTSPVECATIPTMFVGFDIDPQSTTGSPLAGPFVCNAEQLVLTSVEWPSAKRDVRGHIFHGLFGALGLPYVAGPVRIGGDSDDDCAGPACPPTNPGGPPGVPGPYGDPNDDGSPDYDGSIGGDPDGSGGEGGGGSGSGNGGPVITAEGGGASVADPHLVTLDGLRYNFQGAGEFILLASTDALDDDDCDVDGNMLLQVRQIPLYEGSDGAINTAAGIRIGEQTVEIYATPEEGGSHIYINGQAQAEPMNAPVALAGAALYPSANAYTVVWEDGSTIKVRIGYRHLDIAVRLSDARFGQTAGLLGRYNGSRDDDFTTRDGIELQRPLNFFQLYDVLGESWRVPACESLMTHDLGHGDPNDPNYPAGFPSQTIPWDLYDAARERCIDGGVTISAVREACTFDVVLLLLPPVVDEPLITSVIESHVLSQGDIFGQEAPPEVLVAPLALTMNQGEMRTISAAVLGTVNTAMQWTVNGETLGATGPTITWTAPYVGGTYILTGTSQVAPYPQVQVMIEVRAATLTLTPVASQVRTGIERSINASITGMANDELQWSHDAGASGTLVEVDGKNVRFSSAMPTTYHVTATSIANSALTATVTIDVIDCDDWFENWQSLGSSLAQPPYATWRIPTNACAVDSHVLSSTGANWYVSPVGYTSVRFTGTIRTPADDQNSPEGQFGLVMGYSLPQSAPCGGNSCTVKFIHADWGRANGIDFLGLHRVDAFDANNQLPMLGGAGLAVWRDHDDDDTYGDLYKNLIPLPPASTNDGWLLNTTYDYEVIYTPSFISVSFHAAGTTKTLTATAGEAEIFPAGRIGFYHRDLDGLRFTLDTLEVLP
jgi:hypothetical protein